MPHVYPDGASLAERLHASNDFPAVSFHSGPVLKSFLFILVSCVFCSGVQTATPKSWGYLARPFFPMYVVWVSSMVQFPFMNRLCCLLSLRLCGDLHHSDSYAIHGISLRV